MCDRQLALRQRRSQPDRLWCTPRSRAFERVLFVVFQIVLAVGRVVFFAADAYHVFAGTHADEIDFELSKGSEDIKEHL